MIAHLRLELFGFNRTQQHITVMQVALVKQHQSFVIAHIVYVKTTLFT